MRVYMRNAKRKSAHERGHDIRVRSRASERTSERAHATSVGNIKSPFNIFTRAGENDEVSCFLIMYPQAPEPRNSRCDVSERPATLVLHWREKPLSLAGCLHSFFLSFPLSLFLFFCLSSISLFPLLRANANRVSPSPGREVIVLSFYIPHLPHVMSFFPHRYLPLRFCSRHSSRRPYAHYYPLLPLLYSLEFINMILLYASIVIYR